MLESFKQKMYFYIAIMVVGYILAILAGTKILTFVSYTGSLFLGLFLIFEGKFWIALELIIMLKEKMVKMDKKLEEEK